jgi:DNA (cytosine-5)-methyltransferase 1
MGVTAFPAATAPHDTESRGTTSGDGPHQPSPTTFRFVDLFAGIGGIRLGLQRSGGECVFSVEIDRHARRTYEVNFGQVDAWDVRTLDPNSLPAFDVLAAGFPCQPFSIAGVSKKASLGRLHGFDDAASGNLFFEIIRIAESAKPKVLFLENVKNLRSHDRGRTFEVILREIRRLGYTPWNDVIDASYWVPQRRERTFIIAVQADGIDGSDLRFNRAPLGPAPTLRTILEPEVSDRYVLSEALWTYLQAYAVKHRAAGNGFGYRLYGPDEVAGTLSARYYKDGSEILITTGSDRPRRLTPVECGRLMGFPNPRRIDDGELFRGRNALSGEFLIPVSDRQAYKQFGNSVVVPVVEHLGLQVAALLRPQPSE